MEFDSSRPKLMIYGPEMINREADPVTEKELRWLPQLKEYMVGIMQRCDGVGLAAPQVGVFINYAIIELRNGNIIGLINPEITRLYGKEYDGLEGCLSIPPFGNECPVPRMQYIDVESDDLRERKQWRFAYDDARAVQHEIDHLTGTFFIDRVSQKRRTGVLEKFEIWKSGWERRGRPFPYEGELHARVARSRSYYGR